MEIECNTNLEDYVLIKDTRDIVIQPNEGRFGSIAKGFRITSPLAGLILKQEWDYMKEFMSLKINDDQISALFFTDPSEITDAELEELDEVRNLIDLQERSKGFRNTVYEFNLIVGENEDGYLTKVRAHVCIGKKTFEEIEL